MKFLLNLFQKKIPAKFLVFQIFVVFPVSRTPGATILTVEKMVANLFLSEDYQINIVELRYLFGFLPFLWETTCPAELTINI